MYDNIRLAIKGKRVLELCTGTGLIAKNVASEAKEMIATDFAERMLQQAAKGDIPNNLSFRQVDASNIPFDDESFDVVIISNGLGIIPNAQSALSEIARVLRSDGLLIAPNFLGSMADRKDKFRAKLLSWLGIKFKLSWDESSYPTFLENHGWEIKKKEIINATPAIMYTECLKMAKDNPNV